MMTATAGLGIEQQIDEARITPADIARCIVCGETDAAVPREVTGMHTVECSACGARGSLHETEEIALATWNGVSRMWAATHRAAHEERRPVGGIEIADRQHLVCSDGAVFLPRPHDAVGGGGWQEVIPVPGTRRARELAAREGAACSR